MKSMSSYSVSTIVAALIVLSACVTDDPVSGDYFEGNERLAGGEPPSVPTIELVEGNLCTDGDSNPVFCFVLGWTNNADLSITEAVESIDPETGAEVDSYVIYYYYPDPPTKLYQDMDLLTVRSADDGLVAFAPDGPTLQGRSGTHTFIITGSDGRRESGIDSRNTVEIVLD